MLAVLAYRAAAAGAEVLPVPVADALAAGIARATFAARVPARRALEANLARVLPEMAPRRRRAVARQAFVSFALSFTRFLRRHEPLRDVPVHGAAHLEAARASGRGVIVLSAHLGDWESGAAALAARGLPLHVLARPQAAAAVQALFGARRESAGVHALSARAIYAETAAALRRGEWVALMADRGAVRGAGSVCAWAAALAERTGALVLPAVCVREPGGELALRVEPALDPARCREGAFRVTLRDWLARWPGQWAAFEPLPEGIA